MTPLVLVFGMPRSGTTWIGKIFDSHPDTLYCHEPDTAAPINDWIGQFPQIATAESYCSQVQRYVRRIGDMRSLRVVGKLPLFPKSYLSAFQFRLLEGAVYVAKVANRMLGDAPVLHVGQRDAPTLVWKSIESLGRLGVIVSCVPDARAVHILRHPCGYVSSVLRGESEGRFVSDTSAAEDRGVYELLASTSIAADFGVTLEDLIAMKPHERLAWRWLICNETAARELQGSNRYRQVVYDELCRSAMQESRAMFEFAGLSWNRQTEEFIGKSTGRHKEEYYSVYKEPAVAASRWRNDLSSEVISEILTVVARSPIGRQFDP
jgi:hypothetical protein